MIADVEDDGEGARDGTLETDPQQELRARVPPTWREQRPAARGLHDGVVFDDAGEVEDVSASARVDVERDGEPVLGVAVEDGDRAAGKGLPSERFESLLEPLRRQGGQVLQHRVHGSAASSRRLGRRAS